MNLIIRLFNSFILDIVVVIINNVFALIHLNLSILVSGLSLLLVILIDLNTHLTKNAAELLYKRQVILNFICLKYKLTQ